jgi:tRNA threonylcarbamoyladenosine biosynthesis protein TsaB
MHLLALDTSGSTGSLAILKDGIVLTEILWQPRVSHSSELPFQLQQICNRASVDLDQIDSFAVTLGPGSFTGLRIGLSFIKGLALPQRKPVVGISTLLALAASVSEGRFVCPLMDAKRDQIYGAVYEKGETYSLCLEESAQAPDFFLREVQKQLSKFENPIALLGSGVRKYQHLVEKILGNRALILSESFDAVKAGIVGQLGFLMIQNNQFSEGGIDLVPHYLRASEAEIRLRK